MAPVVELGRARRRVIGHRRCVFERAAVFQVRGDAGRAKRVVSGRDTNFKDAALAPLRAQGPLGHSSSS